MSNPCQLVVGYSKKIEGKKAVIDYLTEVFGNEIPSESEFLSNREKWDDLWADSPELYLYTIDKDTTFEGGACFYLVSENLSIDILNYPERYSFDGALVKCEINYSEVDEEYAFEDAIDEYGHAYDYDNEDEIDNLPEYCKYDSYEDYLIETYGCGENIEIVYSNRDEGYGQVYEAKEYEILSGIYNWPTENMKFQNKQKEESLRALDSLTVSKGNKKYAFRYIPHSGNSLMPTEYDLDYSNSLLDVFEAENDDMAILHVLQKYYDRYNDLRSEKTGRILKKKKELLDKAMAIHFKVDLKLYSDWSASHPRFLFLYNYTSKKYVFDPRDWPCYYFEAKYEFDK